MQIVRFLLIHVMVPAAGLQVFVWLKNDMHDAEIERPPIIPLFIIFATYGGWLMIALTLLFWYWSGMALLGGMYLIFVAPIVMTVLAIILYRQRNLSRYHFGSLIASGIYPCLLGLLMLFWHFHG